MNSKTDADAQQHFRSNRKNSRIHPDLSCEVGPPGGGLSSAKVLDLSVGGLKFCCTHEAISNIIPDGEGNVGMIIDIEIDVRIKLPTDKKRATTIKTGARVIHSERLAQDLFHVGIQFKRLETGALRQLEEFIEGSGS